MGRADGGGGDLGIAPHGLDALDVLRLEKGHVYLGQDTLPDDHPEKLGLGWTVAMDKAAFVGKIALERMAALPLERKLVGLRFDGAPSGARRSTRASGSSGASRRARAPCRSDLDRLGWIRAVEGVFPTDLRAGDGWRASSRRRSTTPRGRASVLELVATRAAVITCVGTPRRRRRGRVGRGYAGRVAPDELMLIVAAGGRGACVRGRPRGRRRPTRWSRRTDGWGVWTLDGEDADRAMARLRRSSFLTRLRQGDVARIPEDRDAPRAGATSWFPRCGARTCGNDPPRSRAWDPRTRRACRLDAIGGSSQTSAPDGARA